jgi:hypothetical protein
VRLQELSRASKSADARQKQRIAVQRRIDVRSDDGFGTDGYDCTRK